MGQACRICNHGNRLAIDRALCSGKSKSGVAREWGVSEGSLAYHEAHHLSRQLVQAYQKKAALEGLDLLGEIEDLLKRTKDILTEAEDTGRYNLALHAIRDARGVYDLMAKIAFSLHQARLAELELERLQGGSADREGQETFQESMECLTDAELEMLEKLGEKMQRQDSSIIILPDEKRDWLHLEPTLEPSKQQREAPISPDPVGRGSPEPEEPAKMSTMRRTKKPDRPRVKAIPPTKLEPYKDKASPFGTY